jgi:Fic family protein
MFTRWNWQCYGWPHFTYSSRALETLEIQFLGEAGVLRGVSYHVSLEEKKILLADAMSEEAFKTSEIEGEYLNRDSLQSSIQRHFGLTNDYRKIPAKEAGIVEMMLNLYHSWQEPLTHDMLFDWHRMLTNARIDLYQIGCYRADIEPMQIVSGAVGHAKVHFEAPPSSQVANMMDSFVTWFNQTAPGQSHSLPALTRAGIAHLYFVSIHPFEDGNGCIARALAQKVLFQHLGRPELVALSHVIQQHKKEYYAELEANNKNLNIISWLTYFAETTLAAQAYTLKTIEFLIAKTKFYDRFKLQLNERQQKVIARLFQAGVQGFEGGMSAEKYMRIVHTSRATATRDLQDLVEMRALVKYGAYKSTRYQLNLKVELSVN